jgi:hypothetical protein
MTNSIEKFNQDNPFQELSFRKLVITYLSFAIVVVVAILLIFTVITGGNLKEFHPDPLFYSGLRI